MKVLVCGGRDYADSERVKTTLDSIHGQGEGKRITLVIDGGAKGADALGAAWAIERGVQNICVMANWAKYGRAAGPMRNAEMLELKPDLVVAFPGGRGTADMVRKAKAAGVKVIEIS